MKRLKIFSVGIVIILAVFVSGCVEQNNNEIDNEIDNIIADGTLHLKITDKPGDLDIIHANVTISSIQVHKAEDDNDEVEDESDDEDLDDNDGFIADANGEYQGSVGEEIQFLGSVSGGEEPYNWSWDFGDQNTSDLQNPLHNYSYDGVYVVNLTVIDNNSAVTWSTTIATIGENDDDDSNDGWYTIINESQIFDLIELQNVTDVLGEKNLTVGKYTQIRLTVEKAEITINNSGNIEVHDLNIPSNKVKLVKSFWIYENETTILTLDFDVYRSVHETGNNKYIMKPTIKIIQE